METIARIRIEPYQNSKGIERMGTLGICSVERKQEHVSKFETAPQRSTDYHRPPSVARFGSRPVSHSVQLGYTLI
jgi:hypothetical protein